MTTTTTTTYETVRLKNGAEEPLVVVKTTSIAITALFKEATDLPGVLALYDLVTTAREGGYKAAGDQLRRLLQLGLVDRDGRMLDTVRNVVLSAVSGDESGYVFVNPIGSIGGAS